MVSNRLMQLALLVVAGLPNLAYASADAGINQQPINPNFGQMPLIGEVVSECDDKITACGKQAKVKIIYEAKSTKYITNSQVKYTTTTLSAATSTFTEVKFVTTTTATEGQCRETTTITNEEILEITVDRIVVSTHEFVPIEWVTTTETKTVSEKAIEQCIVKPSLRIGNPGAGQPAENPSSQPSEPPVISQPPAEPSAPGAAKPSSRHSSKKKWSSIDIDGNPLPDTNPNHMRKSSRSSATSSTSSTEPESSG